MMPERGPSRKIIPERKENRRPTKTSRRVRHADHLDVFKVCGPHGGPYAWRAPSRVKWGRGGQAVGVGVSFSRSMSEGMSKGLQR